MKEKNEQEPLINNEESNDKNENINKNILLNSTVIRKEEVKRKISEISDFSADAKQQKLYNNICKMIIIIIIISSLFFFKQRLINIKINYFSDKSIFPLSITYSDPKYNFLLFIIIICCFTISSGFKLLLLQIISFILTLIVITLKNKITNNENIFEKNLIVFHCSDIIISFLFLGEKLLLIFEDNSFNKSIKFIILFLNYNAMIYFILVEITNCNYDDIIIDINWGLLVVVSLYYFVFYVIRIIWHNKILSFLFRNIYSTYFFGLLIFFFYFVLFLYINKLEYFFANKTFMKMIGFMTYLILELNILFSDKKENKLKFFNLYNIYSNAYLYSNTTKINLFIRVTIMFLLEYFLLSKLDFSYQLNMGIFKCVLIIILDIIHGFLVVFIIKYIFNIMNLNNTDLLEFKDNTSIMRYGSFSNDNNFDGAPPLIFV